VESKEDSEDEIRESIPEGDEDESNKAGTSDEIAESLHPVEESKVSKARMVLGSEKNLRD
jgi:hypothetical protein